MAALGTREAVRSHLDCAIRLSRYSGMTAHPRNQQWMACVSESWLPLTVSRWNWWKSDGI
jgi:hypothetical protein